MIADVATPPMWAQRLLELTLTARDENSIAGDLLEEYRGTVAPERGTPRADVWYVRQVAGFLWRATAPIAVLLAANVFIRFLIDARLPTSTFAQRSLISTICSVTIYFAAGAYTGWRTHHVRSGTVIAVSATMMALVLNAGTTLLFLGIWHDSQTLVAVQNSGGFEEHFTLLLFPILPLGALLGTVGAAFGKRLPGGGRGVMPLLH